MKKFIFYISALWASAALFACDDDLQPYNDPNDRIAFSTPDTEVISYTFAYFGSDVTSAVVEVPVTAIGFVTGYDRAVSVRQITSEEGPNAMPGKHYLALDDPSMADKLVVKAGATGVNIPITVYRDETLADEEYILELELVENGFFKPGYLNSVTKTVVISDVLTQPEAWRKNSGTFNWYFGTYSKTRHRVMNLAAADYGRMIDDDWCKSVADGYTVDMAEISFWKGCFAAKLAEINAERAAEGLGNLLNDNGTVLTFPA